MKTSLSGATIFPSPLEKDIEAAGKAGFQGIDIFTKKLDNYLKKNSKEDLKRLLSEYGLGVPSIMAFFGHVRLQEWLSSKFFGMVDTGFDKKLEELKPYLEIANYLSAETLVFPGEGYLGKAITKKQGLEVNALNLGKVADFAKEYGVKITAEWMGQDGPFLDLVEIIRMADRDNLGLLLDSFHWYRGGADFNQIDQIPKGKLHHVHICDTESLPREELTDVNRIYLGLGIIPLVKILEMLKKQNYDGYLSVEIFRPEYWAQDPIEVSRKAYESLLEVMKRANVK